MDGGIHIVRGPARAGKTGHLLARCREVAADRAGTVLWLAPTARRVEQLHRGLHDVPGLRLRTFDELTGELIAAHEPGMRPLARGQARLIVEEVIGEHLAGRRLTYFERMAETRGFA